MAVAQGTAHDTAQDITPAFVAGNDPVNDQEAAGPNVVGDDLERVVTQVGNTGFAGGRFDQGLKQVNFVVGMYMLQDSGNTLKPHAGVNARLGQRRHVAVGIALELHEHQIPDFNVAVTVFFRGAGWATPDVRAMIIENFRTGAAGACIRHLPEVVGCIARALVIANTHDAFSRHFDFVRPDIVGLVVFLIDRDPQLVSRQLINRCQQFPGVMNGITLEIITKAEIAQHFEERVVTCGVADIFKVVVFATGAYAALRTDRTVIVAHLFSGENVFELHHAGIGEQQGWIVTRNEW